MRNRLILITVILAFGIQTAYSAAQNELTEEQKIYATVKLWGFLKYYHPEVTKGSYNWDEQLLGILPKIKEVDDQKSLSKIHFKWIKSLGKVKAYESNSGETNQEYFENNFDLSWMEDTDLFSSKVSAQLRFIEKNRIRRQQYYVSTAEYVGNVIIENEPTYDDFDWKNKDFRILSLAKFWNVIEYFFPYKYQTDQNWDSVLKEMIKAFLNSETEQDFHLVMLQLVTKIDDSHGYFVSDLTNDFFGMKWIPARFKIIDDKAIITELYNDSLAKINDLQIGDVIHGVDGMSISEKLKKMNSYIPASNPSIKLRNSYFAIFNGSTDKLEIEFERKGKKENKTIKRYLFKDFNYKKPKNEKWETLEGNIGYVNMGALERLDVSMMMSSLKNTKAIIFDIRNYPKGTMYAIADYLNSSPKEFVKFTVPSLNYPGKFIWGDAITCGGKEEKEQYKGEIILLVNEQTQSHAEFTCMCLETAENAIIIGSQTSGADGNVSGFEFPGGFNTRFTGIGIYYPDGRQTQRVGIVPDVEVKPSVLGIQEGRDEVLEKALEILLK